MIIFNPNDRITLNKNLFRNMSPLPKCLKECCTNAYDKSNNNVGLCSSCYLLLPTCDSCGITSCREAGDEPLQTLYTFQYCEECYYERYDITTEDG